MTNALTTVARRLPVVVAAMAMGALTACHPSGPPAHPPKPATDNERTIQAMLSVHAHYLWPDRRFPDHVEVPPLEEAAQWLQDRAVAGGYNGFGWSRRRRAIGELAAACVDDDDYCALVLRVFRVDLHPILGKLREEFRIQPKPHIAKMIADDPSVAGEKTDCFSVTERWRPGRRAGQRADRGAGQFGLLNPLSAPLSASGADPSSRPVASRA